MPAWTMTHRCGVHVFCSSPMFLLQQLALPNPYSIQRFIEIVKSDDIWGNVKHFLSVIIFQFQPIRTYVQTLGRHNHFIPTEMNFKIKEEISKDDMT
jgi:hypothetical protein